MSGRALLTSDTAVRKGRSLNEMGRGFRSPMSPPATPCSCPSRRTGRRCWACH